MRDELRMMGYQFGSRAPLISGCVGTGLHGVQKYALTEKAADRAPVLKAGVDAGMDTFLAEVADGVEYDETTRNGNHAYEQISVMARALLSEVIPDIEPAIDASGQPVLECYREAIAIDGFRLTGSLDVETIESDIGDTKTGKSGFGYDAQLGGYSLLKRANTGTGARDLFVDHVPRVPISKPYPGTQRIMYRTAMCEMVAYNTIKHLARDVLNFQATQSPWAFLANPSSQLCSPRYCIAFGTPWCEQTCCGRS
jgi:hypothetical protein